MTCWHITLSLLPPSAPFKYVVFFFSFRPVEMSAKKPVPFLRQVVSVTKKVGYRYRVFWGEQEVGCSRC